MAEAAVSNLPPNDQALQDAALGRRNAALQDAALGRRNAALQLECVVCLEMESQATPRSCCAQPVCNSCVQQHANTVIGSGCSKVTCPSCDFFLPPEEVLLIVQADRADRYRQLLVDQGNNPNYKTCPNCKQITHVPEHVWNVKPHTVYGYHVSCTECLFDWCFSCHSVGHVPIKCIKAKKGEDALFRKWTRECKNLHVRNARKCPGCKTYIQKTRGCNQMECSRCLTKFCYACGGRRIRKIPFLGHSQKYGPFGCKDLLYPQHPHRRRLIRGGILSLVVLASAPIIVIGSLGLIPFLIKKKINTRRRKRELQWEMASEIGTLEEVYDMYDDVFVEDVVRNSNETEATLLSVANGLRERAVDLLETILDTLEEERANFTESVQSLKQEALYLNEFTTEDSFQSLFQVLELLEDLVARDAQDSTRHFHHTNTENQFSFYAETYAYSNVSKATEVLQ